MKTAKDVGVKLSSLPEYPDYADLTGYLPADVVEQAETVCLNQAPAAFQQGYNAELVFRVAAYMVRNNEPASRAYLFC